MEPDQDFQHRKARRGQVLLASLALTAGLAATPTAAHAQEAPEAPSDATDGSPSTSQEAAAPSQVPASSDQGTYEEAGLHTLEIRYVDESGNQIAPTHRDALADGASYRVTSPTVGGYELADASQATVAGTVAKGSGDVSITVTYRSAIVSYTVVHERQVGPNSSEYRIAETETLRAPAGSMVTAGTKEYDNYRCVTSEDERTAQVSADGNLVIHVRYDVIVPSYGIYFETGADYVAPVTGSHGDSVAVPQDPTKPGYAFAGWDTNGDGVADALPATFPDHDITAVALWKPARATYVVNYWGENQNDNGHFHLLESTTLEGDTEGMTPKAPGLATARGEKYQWYAYLREDPVQINGDGTTVLNVYYEWKRVKVYLKVEQDGVSDYDKLPDLKEPFTLKMFDVRQLPGGQDALELYKSMGGTKSTFANWYYVLTNGYTAITNAIKPTEANVVWLEDGSIRLNYRARFTDEELYEKFFGSVYQTADGLSYEQREFKRQTSDANHINYKTTYSTQTHKLVAWRTSENVWDGKDEKGIIWGEWRLVTKNDADASNKVRFPTIDITRSNVIQFMYDRLSFNVTYYSEGNALSSTSYLWGAEADLMSPEGLTGPAGTVFGGWYDNPDFLGDPVSSLTVPVGGCNLYAKWVHPDVRVTFDTSGGTDVDDQTVAWGGKATRPQDPTREGYEFGGWYYAESGSPAPFPFDLKLENDAHLVAAWRSTNTKTSYTVRHVTSDGTLLFEETLEGTVGQTESAQALGRHDARRKGYAYEGSACATIKLGRDASKNVIEFVYYNEPSHHYVVHLWDKATGLPISADVEFDSLEALLNFQAPGVEGYHVLHGGKGYLSTRDGGQELTFWYERGPQPTHGDGVAPGNGSAMTTASFKQAGATARQAKALPQTGDAATGAPIGLGVIGAALAAIGARLHRNKLD